MVFPLRKPRPEQIEEARPDELRLTTHAKERLFERQVSAEAILLIVRHGDIRIASRGCERRRLSRGMAKRLDSARAFTRRTIEEARDTVVVTDPRERVVTVMRCAPDLAFRRLGARPTRQRLWRRAEDDE